MCEPATLAALSFGLGVVQTGMSYMQASAQAEAQDAMHEQNLRNAREAANAQYDAINYRIDQERRAATEKKTEAAIEGAKLRGTARTSAVEAGVAGLSVDALLSDFYASEARYKESVDANYMATRQYLIGEKAGVKASAQNQINAVPRGQHPSPFAAIAQIGAAGLGAYNSYQSMSLTQSQLAKMRMN